MADKEMPRKRMSAITGSVTTKIIAIGVLILLLLIPSSMIRSLVRERENRKKEVIKEICSKWGNEQTIAGPVLSIPYKKVYEDKDGTKKHTTGYVHCLPDELNINATLTPEIRYRSIYEAVVYSSEVELDSTFILPEVGKLGISEDKIVWSNAFLSIGISDMRGIKEKIDARLNNRAISMEPGIVTNDVIGSGVSAKIDVPRDGRKIRFRFTTTLNGSDKISFIPVGKTTNAALASSWASPSFGGSFLPAERKISEAGFDAKWKILHLNRNYPQTWTGSRYKIGPSAFGVSFLIPVDIYQKSMRTVKYAILFLVLTFYAVFFSEIVNKRRIHPIQYLLIGFAITIFYVLLISISEHLSFGISYLLSSISVVALITGYLKAILKDKRFTATVFGILALLYAYFYVLLQLKDYALLMGSIGLFVVLSVIMYITRKIEWYSLTMPDES